MAAELMIGIAVEAVVNQAFSLARERISAAWGVENDLQSLAQNLEMIQAMLSDAETKSINRISSVQIWLRKLEDATSDAYLLLDEYGYYVLRKQIEKPQILKKVHRFFSSSNPIAFRLKMASNIKEINLQMDGIFKEAQRIELVRNATVENSSNIDVRKDRIITGPFLITSEIVGREVDAEKIVTELISFNNQKDDLPVIGIVGMAGQGKTTLAQLVFNNEEVTRCFVKKIWVCVSDDFNVQKILNDMLQCLIGTISMLTTRQAIVEKLKGELKDKKFLLALDDVWNEVAQKWSDMMTCLQQIGGSKGSNIIVTTRNTKIISIMRPSFTHPLGALSAEDSWKLFEKNAFADGEATKTKDLMDEGKKAVQKCCGLPLAIKALAGLMYSNRNASEWLRIVESNIWNSIDPQSSIMPIVKLSYDNLPSLSIKQCFVYCSIFPKDSIIEKEQLIQQWMAHGLLNPSQGSKLEMEDIGNNYFQILLQRSLFQDVILDEFGNINSCKMHDVVHDFASQASKDRCLIIEDGVQIHDTKALHWCISENRSESIDATIPFRLRTLLLFKPGSLSFGQFAECKYLTVLVLSNWKLERLPSSITKMKYLRNLDISGTLIRSLPNSITKLYNLQTLRVYDLQEFPRYFGSFVKLRHFHISYLPSDEMIFFPPGISKMTSLRTLSHFVVSNKCQIKELKSLNNLESELRIYGLENLKNREEAMEADLSKKGNILSLQLHWRTHNDNNDENVLEGLKPNSNLKGLKICGFVGKNLPSWIQLLDNLVKINLVRLSCCEQIPALGQFPCLKVVKIDEMKSLKCIGNEFYWVTSSPWRSSSFPSLRELYLRRMFSLEKWSDPSSDESNIHHGVVFPVLEILEIAEAPKLNQLPNVLNRRIPSLKKLYIYGLHSLEDLSAELLLSLEELFIWRCDKLSTLSTTGERLTSLRRLDIEECDQLDISHSRIDLFAKLEDLSIQNCLSIRLENLRCPIHLRRLVLGLPEGYDGENFPWPCRDNSFAFLDSLTLNGNYSKNIKSLPEQIQHLPALTSLTIEQFNGIEALPEWVCDIPSLRRLEFLDCDNLAYLPSREALERLTTACQLRFSYGSALKERCKEGSGPNGIKLNISPIYVFNIFHEQHNSIYL